MTSPKLARLTRAAVLLAFCFAASPAFCGSPETPKKPITDEVQGVKVVDDYRWLENADDPTVKAWSDAQNAYARSFLDKVKCAPALRQRVSELENSVGVEYRGLKFAGGRFFATKSQPPKQQPLIVMLPSLDDTKGEKIILDPNTLDAGGHTAFDWFAPSPNGKLVAVSLSRGGSESGDVHVYSVDTGEELKGDVVPRVNGGTAGGSLAWTADSAGFFYSRYPREGDRPNKEDMDFYTQVWFHGMSTSTAKDIYETGKDYPKIAEIELEVSPDGNWLLANVQNGDGGEFIQDVKCLNVRAQVKGNGSWTRLTRWDDRIVEAKFGPDSAVYLISRKSAPNGKVSRLPLAFGKAPALADAADIVAEQKDASIETAFDQRNGLWITDSRVYVLYQIGGPNQLRTFDHAGKPLGSIPQPDISTLENIVPTTGDALAFQIDSFSTPPAIFTYAPGKDGTSEVRKTALAVDAPPRAPKIVVKREFAVSKDGTKVPVNIIMRDGLKPDGKTPTIVWGYGGYGVNETPGYSRRRIAWLEQGGIFVLANIRGGGEYGEKWHLEGNLTRKQNVFDDFYAACRHMLDKGYADRDHLSIMGGSNGGLLMGAMITQHPELCKAVVSSVGIYDMLRVELSANGAFNITEFGTVKHKDQFDALYAYSPYHHVKDDVAYPAALFMTGANDPRVDPMQSRKFVARLQAADPKGTFLLRTSGNTGHGMGTPLGERIEQTVDTYGFLFEELGVTYGADGMNK